MCINGAVEGIRDLYFAPRGRLWIGASVRLSGLFSTDPPIPACASGKWQCWSSILLFWSFLVLEFERTATSSDPRPGNARPLKKRITSTFNFSSSSQSRSWKNLGFNVTGGAHSGDWRALYWLNTLQIPIEVRMPPSNVSCFLCCALSLGDVEESFTGLLSRPHKTHSRVERLHMPAYRFEDCRTAPGEVKWLLMREGGRKRGEG